MIRFRRRSLFLIVAVLFLLSFALMLGQHSSPVSAEVLAQDNGIPTIPPSPTPTPTSRPPVTPPTPMPPAEIPEPITVILFGTGLAALSAAAARRKKAE